MMKIACILVCLLTVGSLQAGVGFTDSFSYSEGQASPLWNNEYAFVVEGGTYNAVSPGNDPLAVTTIKDLVVTDAVVSVDILSATDGGLMLHTQGLAANGNMNGVLLVVMPSTAYWHVVQNGGDWTIYQQVSVNAGSETNLHVTVDITGNTYAARIYRLSDNQLVGQTTLVDSTYSSGGIGIYDYAGAQRFDNVTVVPEPATVLLLACGTLLLKKRNSEPSPSV